MAARSKRVVGVPFQRTWTAARRAAVSAYVHDLTRTLRLADWDIRLDFDTPAADGEDLDTVASIRPEWAQKRATIQFGATFLTLSAADQQQTLVHELVHCHLFALHESTHQLVAELPAAVKRLARDTVNFHVESATDALADAFWPLLAPFDLEAAAKQGTARVARDPAASIR